MRVFPRSTAEKIRFGVIALILAGVCAFYRLDRLAAYGFSTKREGDIVFQSLPHGPLVDAIEGITRSEWSHCGILVRKDGGWQVAEAIGEVRYTPLYLWQLRGRGSKVSAYRLKTPPAGINEGLKPGIRRLLGRSYDFRYAPGDDEIYCSELVYDVYDSSFGLKLGTWEKLGNLDWKRFESFIREMENGKLPLDRPMITPVGLTRSPLLEQVF